jgi:dephospho-CoA kinase
MATLAVGLTGGIASGKTLVADFFRAHGVPLIDADVVAREVVAPGSAGLARVRSEFGARFVRNDGALDRAAMRQHVFSRPDERARLEAILHPLMAQRIAELRALWQAPYGILSAAILIEQGMHKQTDRVLVVDVPESLQLDRLVQRDGIDEALARSMLAAQLPRENRLQHATDVIDNAGSPELTRRQVDQLHQAYLALAAARS